MIAASNFIFDSLNKKLERMQLDSEQIAPSTRASREFDNHNHGRKRQVGQLPGDVIPAILSFLDEKDLAHTKSANKELYFMASKSDSYLWSPLFLQKFRTPYSKDAPRFRDCGSTYEAYIQQTQNMAYHDWKSMESVKHEQTALHLYQIQATWWKDAYHRIQNASEPLLRSTKMITSLLGHFQQQSLNITHPTMAKCDNYAAGGVIGMVCDICAVQDEAMALVLTRKRSSAMYTIVTTNQETIFEFRKKKLYEKPLTFLPVDIAGNLGNTYEYPPITAPGFIGYAVDLIHLPPDLEYIRPSVIRTIFKNLALFDTGANMEAYREELARSEALARIEAEAEAFLDENLGLGSQQHQHHQQQPPTPAAAFVARDHTTDGEVGPAAAASVGRVGSLPSQELYRQQMEQLHQHQQHQQQQHRSPLYAVALDSYKYEDLSNLYPRMRATTTPRCEAVARPRQRQRQIQLERQQLQQQQQKQKHPSTLTAVYKDRQGMANDMIESTVQEEEEEAPGSIESLFSRLSSNFASTAAAAPPTALAAASAGTYAGAMASHVVYGLVHPNDRIKRARQSYLDARDSLAYLRYGAEISPPANSHCDLMLI